MSPEQAIASVETFSTPDVALVRARTADGAEGWGQVAPYNADLTAAVLQRQVAPHALGRDAEDLAGIETAVLETEHKFAGSHLIRALGGLDTALWDLRGRRDGKSVCELLGGTPRPFPAYASSMRRDIAPREEAERLMRLRDEHGFGAFKIRVGRECGHDEDEWPGRTEELLPTVRRARRRVAAVRVDEQRHVVAERAAHRREELLGPPGPLVLVVAALAPDPDLERAEAVLVA